MKFRVIELFAFGLFLGSASAATSNTDPTSMEKTCPDGVPKATDCVTTACDASKKQVCYKISDVKAICCARKSFCQMTGMYSYFGKQSGQNDILQYTYQYTAQLKQWWYEQAVTAVNWIPACPRPISYLFQTEHTAALLANTAAMKKILPTDFKSEQSTTALRQCTKNSDCADGQFCGDVVNQSDLEDFAGHDEQNIKFCYSIPPIPAPFTSHTHYVKVPDQTSLVVCNGNLDCYAGGAGANAYCYRPQGKTYSKAREVPGANAAPSKWVKDDYKGLCVESEVCIEANAPMDTSTNKKKKFVWKMAGASTQKNEGCVEHAECGNGGQTRPEVNTAQTAYDNYCIKDPAIVPHGVCCYHDVPACKFGSTESPVKDCHMTNRTWNEEGGFAFCNGGLTVMRAQTAASNKWCDDEKNVCCKNNQATGTSGVQMQFCDDGQTPLFNEPKCHGFQRDVEKSGSCPRDGNGDRIGAKCKNGHCCPDITHSASGGLVLGKNSYVTNHPCIPGQRPAMFSAGFCDPARQVVVILGQLSPREEPLEKYPRDAPKTCNKDVDCSHDNSTLCLFIGSSATGTCYFNPMISVQKPANKLWLAVLITSVVLAFVFLCTSICCMVLYRSKSVFDKYKPKKKGGKKGGKAGSKGSKSKSSKKSKKSKKSKSKETETDTKSVTESKKSVMQ